MELKSGSFVKITKDFESDVYGHLTLFHGDIVKVDEVVNNTWLNGHFGNLTGLFPSSKCTALTLLLSSEPYGVALHGHEAHLQDELSFKAGDQVFFTEKVNSEWYTGHCHGKSGMFPVDFVDIVNDLPENVASAHSPQESIPKRPQSLDAVTLANLRENSIKTIPLSLKNGESSLDSSDLSLERNYLSSNELTKDINSVASNNSSPPKRPPSHSPEPSSLEPSLPARTSPVSPPIFKLEVEDQREAFRAEDECFSQSANNTPKRPPALDNDTVVELRQRNRSLGKKEESKSPVSPNTSIKESPDVDLSTLPSNTGVDTCTSADSTDFTDFTLVRHSGYSDWNKECDVGEVDVGAEEAEYVEEVEYANDGDVQTVEEEHKVTASETAQLKKLDKLIVEKERLLAVEQESKEATEDLLAQQFSGKSIDKENVELLRSLLNAHNTRIEELCNKIDSAKAKARTVKSPSQPNIPNPKVEKLDGLARRDKVLVELLETEESNLKQLKICIKGFVEPLRNNTEHTMDVDLLFLNMENIVAVSEKLLMMLQGQATLMPHEQMIGRCFTHLEEDLHREYTFYLENNAAVMDLIRKYQDDKNNKEMLDTCIIKTREETNVLDLQSMLIRPAQRIMKYPLLLRDMLENTPPHWQDRPFLASALEVVDNIVVYANESKRKDELIKRYNDEVTDSSALPKLTLHSLKKKSKRLTTTLTQSLNITSSVVADSTFSELSENFGSLVIIVKTLIREASNFTDLLKFSALTSDAVTTKLTKLLFHKVQVDMDNLCANIHNFYDDLENQKNVFLYHGAALKIAQSSTPTFIKDLEEYPLSTLNELISFFNAPQYFIEKRNSKKLDYDNLSAQAADIGLETESLRIARGEFEALNKQLLDDLPILVHEGAEVVKKSAYTVLSLFCKYSRSCHAEFRKALEQMSLEVEEPPESIHDYHVSRMKTCCATLLTICSFDKDVTQAIVLGSSMKPASKFYDTNNEDHNSEYDVTKWLESQPIGGAVLISSDDEDTKNTDMSPEILEDLFEKPGIIENVLTGTNCRVLYDFTQSSDTTISVKSGSTVTLVADCMISDTWAYIKCGDINGYVPKSYLTLPRTLKNKPAPQPPSKSYLSRNTSVKRKAPPPPKRSVSEKALPTHLIKTESTHTVSVSPPVLLDANLSKIDTPPNLPSNLQKNDPPISTDASTADTSQLDFEPELSTFNQKSVPEIDVEATITESPETQNRVQPKRTAPAPPFRRRNTAPTPQIKPPTLQPESQIKPPTLQQLTNLDERMYSSEADQYLNVPGHVVLGCQSSSSSGEYKDADKDVTEESFLELSSNLNEIDLLVIPGTSNVQQSFSLTSEPTSKLHPDKTYENFYRDTEIDSRYSAASPEQVPQSVVVPQEVAPNSAATSFSSASEHEYEFIVQPSDTSSEPLYEIIPSPLPYDGTEHDSEQVPGSEFLQPPSEPADDGENELDDVESMPPPDFTPPPPAGHTSSGDAISPDVVDLIVQNHPTEKPENTSSVTCKPATVEERDEPPKTIASTSISKAAPPLIIPGMSPFSIPLSPLSRSSSVSATSTTSRPQAPRSASVSSHRTPPAIPTAPVPPTPTSIRQQKANQGFDDCPMDMMTVQKQKSVKYEAQYAYRARTKAEVTMTPRQTVSVVDTTHREWWYVKIGMKQGYVPATFLKTKS